MIITSITQENKKVFANMIPEDILGELRLEGRYCLGALLKAEDGMMEPAGILFFMVGKRDIVKAEIKWLYVPEEFRKRGVAGELLNSLDEVVRLSGVEVITCQIPFREEYDQPALFLEKEGFSFRLEDRFELDLTLEEILNHPVLSNRNKMKHVQNLKTLGYDKTRIAIGRLIERWSEETMPELSRDASQYDLNVSCGFVRDGEVQGMLLAEPCSDKKVNLVLMRTITGEKQQVLLSLMLDGAYSAEQKYSKDTVIHIECRSEIIGKIIEMMFPDKKPGLVRYGEMFI